VANTKTSLTFEVFEAFNPVSFGSRHTDPGGSGSGKIAAVQQNHARQIQMALKLSLWWRHARCRMYEQRMCG